MLYGGEIIVCILIILDCLGHDEINIHYMHRIYCSFTVTYKNLVYNTIFDVLSIREHC